MRKLTLPIAALIGLFAFAFAPAVFAIEMAADFTTTDAKGTTTTGKIFIKDMKIRQETTAKGKESLVILRMDKKVSWTMMGDNQYLEIALPAVDPTKPNDAMSYVKTVIGREKVSGYDCEIQQYTYNDKSLGILIQWMSSELNYAVKTQTKSSNGKVTGTTIYSNIRMEPQNDALFEPPAGAKPFSVGGMLPGNIKLF